MVSFMSWSLSPGREMVVPSGQETERTPELGWMQWQGEKSLPLSEIKPQSLSSQPINFTKHMYSIQNKIKS